MHQSIVAPALLEQHTTMNHSLVHCKDTGHTEQDRTPTDSPATPATPSQAAAAPTKVTPVPPPTPATAVRAAPARSHGRKQARPKRWLPAAFNYDAAVAAAARGTAAAAAESLAFSNATPAATTAAAGSQCTATCSNDPPSRRQSKRSAAAAANDKIGDWFRFYHKSPTQMLKEYDVNSYARPQQHKATPAAAAAVEDADSDVHAAVDGCEAGEGARARKRRAFVSLFPHDAIAMTVSIYGPRYRLDLTLQKKRAALAVKVQQYLDSVHPDTPGLYCPEGGRWDMRSGTPGNMVMSSAPMLGLSLTFVPSPLSKKEFKRQCMKGVIVEGGDMRCLGCGGVFGRAGFETHLGSNIRHAPDYLVIDELEMTLRDFCVLVSNVDLSLTACVYCFSNTKDDEHQHQQQQQQQQQQQGQDHDHQKHHHHHQQQVKVPVPPDCLLTCPHCPAVFHKSCYEQNTGETIPDSSSSSSSGDGGDDSSWCCGSCRKMVECAAAGCSWCQQQQQQQKGCEAAAVIDMFEEWEKFRTTLPPPPPPAAAAGTAAAAVEETDEQQQQQRGRKRRNLSVAAAAAADSSAYQRQVPRKARVQVPVRTVADMDQERKAEEQRVAAKYEQRIRDRQQRIKQHQGQQQQKNAHSGAQTTCNAPPASSGMQTAAAAAADLGARAATGSSASLLETADASAGNIHTDSEVQPGAPVQQQQQEEPHKETEVHTQHDTAPPPLPQQQQQADGDLATSAVREQQQPDELDHQQAPPNGNTSTSQGGLTAGLGAVQLDEPAAAAAPPPEHNAPAAAAPPPPAAGSSFSEVIAVVNQAKELLSHIKKSVSNPSVHRTAMTRFQCAAAGLQLSQVSTATEEVMLRRQAWLAVHGGLIQSYHDDLQHPQYQDDAWREDLIKMIMNLAEY